MWLLLRPKCLWPYNGREQLTSGRSSRSYGTAFWRAFTSLPSEIRASAWSPSGKECLFVPFILAGHFALYVASSNPSQVETSNHGFPGSKFPTLGFHSRGLI